MKDYHHGNLHEALRCAALEQLQAHGPDKLSLRAIAAQVGVTVAAVYRHVESKEALLAEVALEGFERLFARWDRHLPARGSVRAELRFQKFGELYIHFALEHPAHFKLMFERTDLRAYPEVHAAAERLGWRTVEVAGDSLRESGADKQWLLPLGYAAWSLVHGYAILALNGLLPKTDGEFDLPPDLLTRFLRLPL